jgi:hypothetical protein
VGTYVFQIDLGVSQAVPAFVVTHDQATIVADGVTSTVTTTPSKLSNRD